MLSAIMCLRIVYYIIEPLLCHYCSPLTQPQPGDCSSLCTDISHTISDHNNSGHAGLALLSIDKDDVMT